MHDGDDMLSVFANGSWMPVLSKRDVVTQLRYC